MTDHATLAHDTVLHLSILSNRFTKSTEGVNKKKKDHYFKGLIEEKNIAENEHR